MRASRAGSAAFVAARPALVSAPAPVEPSRALVAAVTRELEQAGRLHTAASQQALLLAARLCSASHDTGSSISALSRELTSVMEVALKDTWVGSGPDPLDQLRRRRDKKLLGWRPS